MRKHIVCLGDSNTHGYCADPMDCADHGARFNENERWTCLLQKTLGVLTANNIGEGSGKGLCRCGIDERRVAQDVRCGTVACADREHRLRSIVRAVVSVCLPIGIVSKGNGRGDHDPNQSLTSCKEVMNDDSGIEILK